MGLFNLLGKLTGVEKDLKWSRCKAIYAQNPTFFGRYTIFVDGNLNVAFFLPKDDGTLHVFFGNPVTASRWLKFDSTGEVILDKPLEPGALDWKINQVGIRLRGRMLPPEKPGYKSDVLGDEFFGGEVTDAWLKEHAYDVLKSMK